MRHTSSPYWVVLTCIVLLSGLAGASWTQQSDEWAGFRHDLAHTGLAEGASAFTPGPGGPARIKWEKDLDHPVLYPPSVGDMDRNGVKEIVVTPTDVKTKVGPPPDINFLHKVQSLSGTNGNTAWTVNEANSFALFNGASIVDIDADGNAEVLYFAGNPLTGTSATNKVVALNHNGGEQWRFSSNDWGALQHPIGILSGLQAANVDDEAQKEALAAVVLADISIGTTDQGPDCPNPDGQKIKIEGTNIRYFIHAINGEGANPSSSWQREVDPGLLASTPAVVDLNGDGKLDPVWGSGTPSGTLIPSCSAEVSVDESAEDNRVLAVDGANPPDLLWTFTLQDPPGIDRPLASTPTVAGTTPDGDPILVFLVPVPDDAPPEEDPDRNILLALNGHTGTKLWSTNLRPPSIAPLAAADLDDDGQPEIIVQVANRLATFRNQDGSDFWAQGTGDFRGKTYARTLTAAGPVVGDIDGDGTREILSVLAGSRTADKAALLVVNGADGAVEWTFDFLQDQSIPHPVLADVDGDDDQLLEIVLAGGSFTLGDDVDHRGKVVVLEPNAPDLAVTTVEVIGTKVNRDAQTVRASVTNPGTRDATGATFRLLVNGVAVGPDLVDDVAVGATRTLDFPWTPTAAGAYTVKVVADPAKSIRELVETNNEKSVAVTILKRYDLKIAPDDVSFAPVQPILGDTVTVRGTVRNVGEVATPAASVLRFEEAGIPLAEDKTIPVLDPGASVELSVEFEVAEERTHHFVLTADPADDLDEELETNNVAAKDLDILVVRPDYVVEPADIAFSNNNPILGEVVTVTVTVHNVGNQDAPATTLRLSESGVPVGSDLDVPAIPQGGSNQVQRDFEIQEEREHTFEAAADPDDLVDEFNEDNNTATKDLAVNVVRPDFSIEPADIAFSNNNPILGEIVTVTITVHNVGNQDAPATKVRLSESGVPVGDDLDVPAIPQGGSNQVQRDFEIQEEREHTFEAAADPDDLIDESNEDNNAAVKKLAVNVVRPDLSVVPADIVFSNENPVLGETITITVTVENLGNGDSPATPLRITESGVAIGPDLDVPALAPGESADVETDYTIEAERTHTFTATADPANAVEELDETNNAASRSLDVPITRPDLSIEAADIAFSDENPAKDDTITITVTVHNLGTRDAPASFVRITESGSPIGPDLDVPALAQGASVDVETDYTIAAERTHTFTAKADPDGVMEELDETNNAATRSIEVRITRPDLVAVALTPAVGIADPGDTVRLTADFRNDGDRAVTAFIAEFLDGATSLGTVPGPAIPVGGTGSVEFDWLVTEPRDVHTLRVVGTVVAPEPNTANNEASTDVVVGTLDVQVAMDSATFPIDAPATGTVQVLFMGTTIPVPDVPLVVDVYYRIPIDGGGVSLLRARIEGTTDALGRFPFEVPMTLLGDNTVCIEGECIIEDGVVAGNGVNVPGEYRVVVRADRLGFVFQGRTSYAVPPPMP